MNRSLRSDLHKAQLWLDQLPPYSAVTDRDGYVWMLDHWGVYWRGELEGVEISSFELAQYAPLKLEPTTK